VPSTPPPDPAGDPADVEPPPQAAPAERLTVRVIVFRSIGVAAVALAAAGVVLPLLPTTPFLLVALWAFARGSPKLADRLRNDRRYGPVIRNWEERRAIPVKAKAASILAMSASLAGLALTSRNWVVVAVVGAILATVGVYILTRPSA
jgi:uncharacterized membrane protein YbaN (DUF454 family)